MARTDHAWDNLTLQADGKYDLVQGGPTKAKSEKVGLWNFTGGDSAEVVLDHARCDLEWRAMGDDNGLKSSYDLAMERLRKSDKGAGIERRPVTEAQKAAIAEIRNLYESKIAELEVLHQGRLRTMADPDERATREGEYRRDRERLSSERDAKIEKARQA